MLDNEDSHILHVLEGEVLGPQDGISVAYAPAFFSSSIEQWVVLEGLSIAEIIASCDFENKELFWRRGSARINGEEVPRNMWSHVRPKVKKASGEYVSVTLHMAPGMGGLGGGSNRQGGSTAKNVLTIVAAVAIVAATGFIGAGGLVGFAGLTAAQVGAGTLGAALAAAAVGTTGMLLLNALSPPPATLANQDPTPAVGEGKGASGGAGAQGNVLDPGGFIQRVIGTMKVFPQLASPPYVFIDGENEFVEALYVLDGAYQFTDLRIEDVPIAEIEDVEYETSEGLDTSLPLSMIDSYAHIITPQIELSRHILNPDSTQQLANPANPEGDLPIWHVFSTRDGPDEIHIHLIWPQGVFNPDFVEPFNHPLRIRMRKFGDVTWINLPEIHFTGDRQELYRKDIILKFYAAIASAPSPPSNHGFTVAFDSVPVDVDGNGGWTANSHFSGGGAINDPAKIFLFADRVEIYLDNTTTFPLTARWEISIKAGSAFRQSVFVSSVYTISGAVRDPFGYVDAPGPNFEIADASGGMTLRVMVLRIISRKLDSPLPDNAGVAFIAVRARNRNLTKLSVVAASRIPDWNGSIWTGTAVVANPASHFYNALTVFNPDPLPVDSVDNANIVAFRTFCTTNSFDINAIVQGGSVLEILRLIASCGRGRPRMSDIWGVVYDYDRAADLPVQTFGYRNTRNFSFEKAFPARPDALRIRFTDSLDNYEENEVIVEDPYVDPMLNSSFLYEEVTYRGLVTEARIRRRALYDFRQMEYRSAVFSFEADIEQLVCRKGDLIAVAHDILNRYVSNARIKSVTIAGPNVTGLVLDSKVEVYNETTFFSVANVFALTDVFTSGLKSGVSLRYKDGTHVLKAISTATGYTETLTFTTPFATPANLVAGMLVTVGILGQEYKRMIVTEIRPAGNFMAALTCVDEAPEVVFDV